jgi:hypothetical protein
MKNSIALMVALLLGLAGCSAATLPAWQTEAGAVAHQAQAAGQSQAPQTWDDSYVDYRP